MFFFLSFHNKYCVLLKVALSWFSSAGMHAVLVHKSLCSVRYRCKVKSLTYSARQYWLGASFFIFWKHALFCFGTKESASHSLPALLVKVHVRFIDAQFCFLKLITVQLCVWKVPAEVFFCYYFLQNTHVFFFETCFRIMAQKLRSL